jgi:tetratricopeptide (TPR) repeat protein
VGWLAGQARLNVAAIRLSKAVVDLSYPPPNNAEIARKSLRAACNSLQAHQLERFPGGAGFLVLVTHLIGPAETKIPYLETALDMAAQERPFVKLWLGEAYLEQGDYLKALSLWAEIGAAQQLLELGDWLSAAGRWEEATAAYQASLRSIGSDVRPYLKLGHALIQLGREDDALSIYERALAIDPGDYGVYVAIGDVYRDRKMFEEAQAWYDRAVQQTGNLEWPYIASAHAYEMEGSLDLAKSRLQIALKNSPSNCQAWGQMGVVLRQQRLYSEAILALEMAIRLCPEIPWLYQAIGDAKRDSGDLEGARQAYKAVLTLSPADTYVREQLDSLDQMLLMNNAK